MGFSEKVKDQALEMSIYRCCVCENTSISLEVHHIIPQEEGGPDTIDNAAPLCPNCHSDYGDNKKKQSFLRKKRDDWYKRAQNYSNMNALMDSNVIKPIFDLISDIRNAQVEQNSQTEVLKDMVSAVFQKAFENSPFINIQDANNIMIRNITPATADYVTTAIINASTPVINNYLDSNFLGYNTKAELSVGKIKYSPVYKDSLRQMDLPQKRHKKK